MDNLSLLQEMLDSVDEIETIFQEYILIKDAGSKPYVFCFFEGKDDYKYYCSRIKLFTVNESVCYDCGGKEGVLTLYGMIKENTISNEGNDILFFVDKDFDVEEDICEEIYSTPCYSIENLYITNTCFTEFLKGELKISKFSHIIEDKRDYERVMAFFNIEKQKFINETLLLNIWYSLQKNKSRNVLCESKPDLSKVKSIKNIEFPITLGKLKELTSNYIEVSDAEIINEKIRLMNNPESNFRGKYFEEFLFKIFTTIITDSNRPKTLFSKRRKVNLNIGKDNLISLLSQYADVPTCLLNYLEKRIRTSGIERRLATS